MRSGVWGFVRELGVGWLGRDVLCEVRDARRLTTYVCS